MSYLYGWQIEERGLTEVPESEYNDCLREKAEYINTTLKNAMLKSDCGFDNLRFIVLKKEGMNETFEYMVISCGSSSRYYSVTASSKMSCLKLLGEIIF